MNPHASQIRHLMERHGLTQRKLADLTGLSLTTVTHACKGDVGLDSLKLIINKIKKHYD